MSTLQTVINDIDDNGTITLSSGFAYSNVALNVSHDRDFVINGADQTISGLNIKHFRFNKNAGTGNNTITINNIIFDGNNKSGGVSVTGAIKTSYDNVKFINIRGGRCTLC